MTATDIPLKLPDGIVFIKSFRLIANKKSKNLAVDLNGNYDNKKVISSVSATNWKKTRTLLREALKDKGVNDNDIELILDILDNNSDTVLEIIRKDGNGDSEDDNGSDNNYESSEITRAQIIKTIEEAKRLHSDNLTFEAWSSGLTQRYEAAKQLMDKDFPNGWAGIEFTLSVMKILNIAQCDLPFAGIMLARSGGLKTLGLDMLVPWPVVYHTRKFNPRAFVTHNTAVESEEALKKIDLLPRIRFKLLVTPELSTIFSANEDELLENVGIITSILDGRGYTSDSGAHGQRGYHGNYHFGWVGASVDIPHRVHKLLSTLGPKLYVLRLPYDEPKDEAVKQCLNEKFRAKYRAAQNKLMEYLVWFELCPALKEDPETKLPKIEWDSANDDPKAIDEIVRLAKLLGRIRCHVEIWSPKGQSHEYAEFGHSSPSIEDPRRAATCLYNLTRGYALTRGRNYITLEDLHLAIKVALTTGSKERIAVFDFLVAKKGVATLASIANALTMSKTTALRYMTELSAVGLTELEDVTISGNPTQQIKLLPSFSWLYSDEFLKLKGDYSPIDRSKYHDDGRQYQEDPKTKAFWTAFGDLELLSVDGTVKEIDLKNRLMNETQGIFTGPIEIEILIKKMFNFGKIGIGAKGYYRKTGESSSTNGGGV
jgi:hypothetical protein